jgi:cytochrome P450
VHWNPEPAPNRGFWAITRYHDIWTVDRDTETFTSAKFVNLEEIDDDLPDVRRSILETDGPRHQAMRQLITREFSPRNLMRNYEGFLRELTRKTVDEALSSDEFDFVRKISADFPIQVLARLLDVPLADTGQLIRWGNEMVGNTDPEYIQHTLDSPESEKYKHLPSSAVPLADHAGRLRLRPGAARPPAGRQRHRSGQPARQQDPERRRAAERQGLRQLLPAADHRRQRDHPARDQQRRVAERRPLIAIPAGSGQAIPVSSMVVTICRRLCVMSAVCSPDSRPTTFVSIALNFG